LERVSEAAHTEGAGGRRLSPHARLSRLRAMAFDPRLIDELARRLAGSVPEGVRALRNDLEQNFKGVLQAGLAKFDLVTREEFDIQTAVLRRTREKLAELEQRLRELEGER
jgi:BMFP domain-containing protein YqiC